MVACSSWRWRCVVTYHFTGMIDPSVYTQLSWPRKVAGILKSLYEHREALELDFGLPTRLITLSIISCLSLAPWIVQTEPTPRDVRVKRRAHTQNPKKVKPKPRTEKRVPKTKRGRPNPFSLQNIDLFTGHGKPLRFLAESRNFLEDQ